MCARVRARVTTTTKKKKNPARFTSGMARVVLESVDLASLVAEHLDPTAIVALGRVSRDVRSSVRSVIRGAPRLLALAARNAGALTKTQLMGFLALTSAEADALPRSQYARLRGRGFYFLYRDDAFDHALAILGSADEWEARLHARAVADPFRGGAGGRWGAGLGGPPGQKRRSGQPPSRGQVLRCRLRVHGQ